MPQAVGVEVAPATLEGHGSNARTLRVALLADLLEEGWPSMDLVAEMLAAAIPEHPARVQATLLRAPFVRRLPSRRTSLPRTPDRVVNRFWDYPRWVRRQPLDHHVYHVLDHSYAHLVRYLPAERTVVFCHDTDAFRPFFDPHRDTSKLPRYLSGQVLDGLRRAARVLCISHATRQALEDHGLVDAGRLRVVPLGVHPSCSARQDAGADRDAAALLTPGRTDLLHVGSTIPRKRIDVLLDVLAGVRATRRDVRLVRVGGALTPGQEARARRLGVREHILELPFLSRSVLAAVYRRAAVVLLTSEREGFGLPIVEALACGTPVVATDLPVCREVGGDAVEYCSLGAPQHWVATVGRLLEERHAAHDAWSERRRRAEARGRRYSWEACADACVQTYREVASASGAWAATR